MATIDLDQAEKATKLLLINNEEKQEEAYQEKILRKRNDIRHVYLPMFPTIIANPINCLLLANTPVNRLSFHEFMRRQHGGDTKDAIMLMNQYSYSNKFHLLENDAEELAQRLKIPKSIITFNAERLRSHTVVFCGEYEYFRRNVLRKKDKALAEPVLNSKQMAQALEFYLQIDLDVFYMKTCSFRGAQPLSAMEGLFCNENEPEARYQLNPCGQVDCCLCCNPNIIDFTSTSMHQFINGYTTYLNCPAKCTTSNVIYALTCPCGKYDYIDSTSKTLTDAIAYHRQHINRIIHEKLTGLPTYRHMISDDIDKENEIANKMRLYEHIARCPDALQNFLNSNPNYWCFIPIHWDEAIADNAKHLPSSTSIDPALAYVTATTNIDDPIVAFYIENVPLPSVCYTFSYQQLMQQRLFFDQYSSTFMNPLPYKPIDIYKVAIIAVLPENSSIILRYVIETLFIIHGETKLNMICPIGGDAEKRYGPVYKKDWYANLKQSSGSTTK